MAEITIITAAENIATIRQQAKDANKKLAERAAKRIADQEIADQGRRLTETLSALKLRLGLVPTEDDYVITKPDMGAIALCALPEVEFFVRKRTSIDEFRQYLVVAPRFTVPEGPEFEDWWDNPLNQGIPESAELYGPDTTCLADLGKFLERLEKHEKIVIQPWPADKERAALTKATTPKKFQWLLEDELNGTSRPFMLTGQSLVHDNWLYTLVEYLDVD